MERQSPLPRIQRLVAETVAAEIAFTLWSGSRSVGVSPHAYKRGQLSEAAAEGESIGFGIGSALIRGK